MKKWIIAAGLLLFLAAGMLTAKYVAESAVQAALLQYTQPVVTVPEQTTAAAEETEAPTTLPTEVTEEQTQPYLLSFTEEEETLLLKLGMAERGEAGCTDCIALVMRTVLNRAEGPKFSSTIKGVIYAQDQFTPVADGTFESAVPNDRCREALDMVKRGWDESQGAMYYEWCTGESWHSKNLNLLFQHCDVRFYN